MSFGLNSLPETKLTDEIDRLVGQGKLVFAAASNRGGNSGRTWPASHPRGGVICIHAADELATPIANMNPLPLKDKDTKFPLDNFMVLGRTKSYWKMQDIWISGTSFATPIAAAIAANVLEFARRKTPHIADRFAVYSTMRHFFREYMTVNNSSGMYHHLQPWADDLWSPWNTPEKVCEQLENAATR
jgi:hypothetical protein